ARRRGRRLKQSLHVQPKDAVSEALSTACGRIARRQGDFRPIPLFSRYSRASVEPLWTMEVSSPLPCDATAFDRARERRRGGSAGRAPFSYIERVLSFRGPIRQQVGNHDPGCI